MADKDMSGGSAFPHKKNNNNGTVTEHPGMTLRDYFAGQALMGEMASQNADKEYYGGGLCTAAETAYALADAMLAARGEKP